MWLCWGVGILGLFGNEDRVDKFLQPLKAEEYTSLPPYQLVKLLPSEFNQLWSIYPIGLGHFSKCQHGCSGNPNWSFSSSFSTQHWTMLQLLRGFCDFGKEWQEMAISSQIWAGQFSFQTWPLHWIIIRCHGNRKKMFHAFSDKCSFHCLLLSKSWFAFKTYCTGAFWHELS